MSPSKSVALISQYFDLTDAYMLPVYEKMGGYEVVKRAVTQMKPTDIESEVKKSNLRGLGGAGFKSGIKWSFVPRDSGKPIYLVVNADEGEPGTFKDRYVMTQAPHLLLEGIILCAYAVGIHKAYIYVRGEYTIPIQRLKDALESARARNYVGEKIFGTDFNLEIVVHQGAGAYICGEETALLESLEGKKGYPRLKPPFPAVIGLYRCPTLIHNVETLSYLPFIVQEGGEAFAKLGSETSGGLRLYSVSGHVQKPGLYERPMNITLRQLLEDAGGVWKGRQLKAVVPGGMSASVLTANEIDITMDFDSLKKIGSMGGSAGVMVMDEETCMVRALFTTMRFYAHESCGQCSPCREGTGWVARILKRILDGDGRVQDIEQLLDIGRFIGGTTICALADGAQMPLMSYIQKFRSEFEYYVRHGCSEMETKVDGRALV